MQIRIDGKNAAITLESEKTVGEVLTGIQNWLEGSGFFLSGLELDGKTYGSLSLDTVFDLPLEGISSIDVKTSGWAELMLEALVGLKSDLEFFGTLDSQGQEQCRRHWENAVPALFLKEHAPDLYNVVVQTLHGNFPSAGTIALASERIREIENPSGEIADSQALVAEIAKRLEDLPLDIQTGKDGRAAETITLFSALAEKMYRLLSVFGYFGTKTESIEVPIADGSVSLKEYIDEFSTALKELVSAYENNDTVLVGDLAEYELSPRLLCLSGVLTGIILKSSNREKKQG